MANILAVDDNLELCKLIRTTLERDGHRVETRQAGRDLTEALCRWADCILPVSYTHLGRSVRECENHVGENGESCAESRVRPDT